MSTRRPFEVLLISPSEYRIDGAFRYTAAKLPDPGELITVVDDDGLERQALVRRVRQGETFAIHATELATLSPERRVGPRERRRRGSDQDAERVVNARRGWLGRHRRRRLSG
jgi:hypothetical protein